VKSKRKSNNPPNKLINNNTNNFQQFSKAGEEGNQEGDLENFKTLKDVQQIRNQEEQKHKTIEQQIKKIKEGGG
jgi:hypothetical protein